MSREIQRVDDRETALEAGLMQLSAAQLSHLADYVGSGGEFVLDEVHYDEGRGLWCPLAVGLGVPEVVESERVRIEGVSETKIKSIITGIGRESIAGFNLNPVGRFKGEFFTSSRSKDLGGLILRVAAQAASN